MATIEIYTKPTCPYCLRAKALLDGKGAVFSEIDVSHGGAEREAMLQRANGGATVPQIFIDGKHIGGSDALHALDRSGQLDTLLRG